VAWSTVRMLLTLSEIHGWHARQINFVLAFPQAKVKTDVYMQIPEKFNVNDQNQLYLDKNAQHPTKQDLVVKLIKNVYGLKDANKTWFDYISAGLLDYGFTKSQINPCLNVKGNILFSLYVDNAICLTPSNKSINK
jgi:Reverse transcriptase (RNA-dependent DNA polymerase)